MSTTIARLPETLIVHLKRLVMNANGGGKVRTLVKFPVQSPLDMAPYTTAGRVRTLQRKQKEMQQTAAIRAAEEEAVAALHHRTTTPTPIPTTGVDQSSPPPTASSSSPLLSQNETNTGAVVSDVDGNQPEMEKKEAVPEEDILQEEEETEELYSLYGVVNHIGGFT